MGSAFTTVSSGATILASDLNQVIQALNGANTGTQVLLANQLLLGPGSATSATAPTSWGSVPVKVAEDATTALTISSFPTTFRGMLLSWSIRAPAVQDLHLRLNGSTGGNYDYSYQDITTGAGASTANGDQWFVVGQTGESTSYPNTGNLWLWGYASTSANPQLTGSWQSRHTYLRGGAFLGQYTGAGPITSLQFTATGTTIGAGSFVIMTGIP